MSSELVLLVGPQGSGKTTFAKKELPDYFRISQDEQGKNNHFEIFKSKLDEGKNIVVDRINHLRLQRKKYLDEARDRGYRTRIIVFGEDFKTCIKRILLREEHPNLGINSDRKKILSALRMYFRNYEFPLDNEADLVEFKSEFDPFFLDLSKKYSKFLVIGDVHGCFDQLKKVLDHFNFKDDGEFAVVLTGDLVDKGIKSKEVLDLVINSKHVFSVKGNHEYRLSNFFLGGNINSETEKSLGLNSFLREFNDFILGGNISNYLLDLISFLESMPYIIKLSKVDYVVHAGINPNLEILENNRPDLIFIRTFNANGGKYYSENDPFWFELYSGEDRIYFGHHYHRDFNPSNNVFSMDGYCFYGNELRSVLLDFNNLKSPIAKKFFLKSDFKSPFCNYRKDLNLIDFDLSEPFEKEYSRGYLKKSELNDLVLYCYNNSCVYENYWNKTTLSSRGIIIDKKKNCFVAVPFKKFFNLGEREETQLKNLPFNLEYEIFEKLDGALIIVYFYQGKWRVASKGSLNSIHSLLGEKLLKKYDISHLNSNFTYLFEMLHPSINSIIKIDNREDLVLLGAVNKNRHSFEMSYDELKLVSEKSGFPLVKKFDISFEEAVESLSNLGLNSEGYVVRFENGLRVKLKSEDYIKNARILLNLDSLSLWKAMRNGRVNKDFLMRVPEEFRIDIDEMAKELEDLYLKKKSEVFDEFEILRAELENRSMDFNLKNISSFLDSEKTKFNHSSIFFEIFKGNETKIDDYVMRLIRPSSK